MYRFVEGDVYNTKKSRGINWTHEEKLFLVDLCSQKSQVIEEKRSDLITLSKKAAAWRAIYDRFSVRFGRKRTPIRIKEQWKRMKISARAKMRDLTYLKQRVERGETVRVGENAKYYGESEEIICHVTQILQTLDSENKQPIPRSVSVISGDGSCDIHDSSNSNDAYIVKIEPAESNEMIDNDEMEFIEQKNLPVGPQAIPETQADTTPNIVGQINAPLSATLSDQRNEHVIPPSSNHYSSSSQQQISHLDRTVSASSSQTLNAKDFLDTTHQNTSLNDKHDTQAHSYQPFCNHRNTKTNITSFPNISVTSLRESTLQNDGIESRVLIESQLEYARIEHQRKMQYMKEEHLAKLEILRMEKDIAAAKLRKAELKLRLSTIE